MNLAMAPAAAAPICRVCGSTAVQPAGQVEYFEHYSWRVTDCTACGCRYTAHDGAVYEALHQSGAIDYYADYRGLAAQAKRLFDARDLAAYQNLLFENAKYRFVITETASVPPGANLLEVGCSRGYLTAYFVAKGWRILGVDASSDAIHAARRDFGDHFALAGSPAVQQGAPYDVIYHVGTIGCVADPIGMTHALLDLLKPGGRLLFNAPNRRACSMRNQLWLDTAPPPDLVTLYPEGFWRKYFGERAEVRESVEMMDANRAFAIAAARRLGRSWRLPRPKRLNGLGALQQPGGNRSNQLWRWIERQAERFGRLTGASRLASPEPTEFGLFVVMSPKNSRMPKC
jgi:SAM-dependent methyltransferase